MNSNHLFILFPCNYETNIFLCKPLKESPTRELADHSFPLGGESGTKSKVPNQQERVNVSDDSSDGNISEESKSWTEEFGFLLCFYNPPIYLSAIFCL